MFIPSSMRQFAFVVLIYGVLAHDAGPVHVALDYFLYKNVKLVCFFSRDHHYNNIIAKSFMKANMRVVAVQIDKDRNADIARALHQWNVEVGVLLDAEWYNSKQVLHQASRLKLFDAAHVWAVVAATATSSSAAIEANFYNIELGIDSDIVVVVGCADHYKLTAVYSFGRPHETPLESSPVGTWQRDKGLTLLTNQFKYYERWDFHNATLRAVSVVSAVLRSCTIPVLSSNIFTHFIWILEPPKVFDPELLSDIKYTPGVSPMTKIASQLLNILKEQHNFRFNYTIASRWIGSPERNSTLAVSNSLYWGEQDISSTSARIFPRWLDWFDMYFPPVTHLETKFYYVIPDQGVGDYENRFLTPMSLSVWWCSLATGVICAIALGVAALVENRPQAGSYAFFSVFATGCQQDFEDGVQITETRSSQGRRGTLFVVGLTSMLLYNYYTSSVVSWLLNAAAPSISSIDALMNSDLEVIFEDIGYTRGWLENPGFFYFSGYVNMKEDELRIKKVTNARRTLELLQPVETGIQLIRTGRYAYHTEPFTASQVISRRFEEKELCELGALQMMLPAHTYIYAQKRSPYKQFFVWSLMRLLERGHVRASQARFSGTIPACSGRMPRALALGQAAPAFMLLLEAALLSTLILLLERMRSRYHLRQNVVYIKQIYYLSTKKIVERSGFLQTDDSNISGANTKSGRRSQSTPPEVGMVEKK